MKHRVFSFLAIAAGIFCANLPAVVHADSADVAAESASKSKKSKKDKKSKKTKKGQAEAKIGALGQAIQNAEFFTEAKPNPAATHYFFLESASWCVPCKTVMPKIVEEYPKMREAGVEVILVANESEADAKKYLEGYKAEFAGVSPVVAKTLPGYAKLSSGVPSMCLVDAEGNLVTNGHGRMLLQWRQLTNQPEEPGPGAVAEALKKVNFYSGKPMKDAKYYIYLHSSSTCAACSSIVPGIIKEYKKMKKAKVELILVNHDSTEAQAKAYVKANRIKFAAVMDSDETARTMPGYTPVSGIPYATIVDKHGTVLKHAHGSVVLEWKTFCP